MQLTWLSNYNTSSSDAAYDLVAYSDKILDPVISARVMIKGLLDGRWNAAEKGISTYLPTTGPDDLKNVSDKQTPSGAADGRCAMADI